MSQVGRDARGEASDVRLQPSTSSPPKERQFVMAYGACRIWRLLEGPSRGEYLVATTAPPLQEWTVATLPAAHQKCQALERREPMPFRKDGEPA